MERRVYQRHILEKDHALRATIIMSGGSLLAGQGNTSIEIEGRPVNISQGGLCVILDYDATWEVLSSNKDLEIHLDNGSIRCSTRGHITHFGSDRSVLGIRFSQPLANLASLIHTQ